MRLFYDHYGLTGCGLILAMCAVFAIFAAGGLGLIIAINSAQCDNLSEYGYTTDFKWIGGCYVETDNGFYPVGSVLTTVDGEFILQ